MTSVFSPNINLEEPSLGDYPNSWNLPLNSNLSIVDQAFGSSTSIAFSNNSITLTVAQAAYFQIVCTGTLTTAVQLILPGTIGGRRVILNQCTGAFTLTVLNGSGDTGGGVVVGQGFQTSVVLTAGRAYYDAYAATPPGTILPFAGVTPPPGFLLCYGQSISRATYAQLFAAIGNTTWGGSGGNFNLPDLRGRLLAGADDMGGTPAGRLSGYSVGVTGGAQTNTANTALSSTSQLPQFTPSGSVSASGTGTASASFGALLIGGTGGIGGLGFGGGSSYANIVEQGTGGTTVNVSVSTSGSLSGNTIGSPNPNFATSAAFFIIPPTAAINYMIRY